MSALLLMMLGFALSFGAVYFLMPHYILLLKKEGMNQEVSPYALDDFKEKGKTPIMGGLLFVVLPLLVTLLIKPDIVADKRALLVMLSYFLFCLIGFADDILILIRHNNDGLPPKAKLLMQLIFACVLFFMFRKVIDVHICLPFTDIEVDFGWLYLPFMVLLYAAEANAVNFTDGMDGLCAGVSFISLTPFVIFALLQQDLNNAILTVCVGGGLLAYLNYNFFPAKIFMGDSGSLALGALFASLSVVLNQEVALFFAGGVFVWEMFCVTLQLFCVKVFHKRVFSYTPIHYAFRLKGLSEKKIVLDFYKIAACCALVGALIGILG